METILALLIIGYWVIALASGFVYRARAGLGVWHGIALFGDGGVGLGWAALTLGKMLGWPVVLGVWIASDRPQPRIVFNDKALARRQAEALA